MTIKERFEEIEELCERLKRISLMSDKEYLTMMFNEENNDVDCHASADDGCTHCDARD